ncbi:hypothetical protein CIB95_01580 [Lottiidibacillus patelloidae]|uniref:Uncharacterized protein n=1 Tax=Lottiidibacillus patelloidae TaxID=2670334 RepID=A0A263BXH8_9BACI|nr:hypothetical protein [Lottiidibacillus patelloidae]OZM58288.1 hypothetical protein CIB95_01580 [Lottiidibacillus patelloidae]
MSERKKKVLQVDELIVKANKVIILDQDQKKDKKDEPKRRDPWGWSWNDDQVESSSSSSSSSEILDSKDDKPRDPWL